MGSAWAGYGFLEDLPHSILLFSIKTTRKKETGVYPWWTNKVFPAKISITSKLNITEYKNKKKRVFRYL